MNGDLEYKDDELQNMKEIVGIVEPSGDAVENSLAMFLGNPLVDFIVSDVPEDFLEKYELQKEGAILVNPVIHSRIFDEIQERFSNVLYAPGGSALNSARICQAIFSKTEACAFSGCVGKDDLALKLRKIVENERVKCLLGVSDQQKTGVCAVLVSGCQRTLCTDLRAATSYCTAFLNQQPALDVLNTARIFYITGFFFSVCPEAMKLVGKQCVLRNAIFCTNLSAEFIVHLHLDVTLEALTYADYVFGNESEFKKLAIVLGFGTTKLEDIAAKVQCMPKYNKRRNRIVIITDGANEVVVASYWPLGGVRTIKYPVISVQAEDIVDTNGAGDAFVGGFISGLLEDMNLDMAIARGILAAEYIIRASGCNFDTGDLRDHVFSVPNFLEAML